MNKKDLIYLSGIKIISEKGFSNTKVQDICEDAKISVGSFYNYYKDKKELLNYIFENRLINRLEKLRLINLENINALEKIELYFDYLASETDNNSKLEKVIRSEYWQFYRDISEENKEEFYNLNKEIENIFTKIITEGQEKKLFSKNNPLIIFKLLDSIIGYNLEDNTLISNNIPLKEIKNIFIELIVLPINNQSS